MLHADRHVEARRHSAEHSPYLGYAEMEIARARRRAVVVPRRPRARSCSPSSLGKMPIVMPRSPRSASTSTTTRSPSARASRPTARSCWPGPRRSSASHVELVLSGEVASPALRVRRRSRPQPPPASNSSWTASFAAAHRGHSGRSRSRPAGAKHDPPQVLYVGGWGRSGSTLLSHLLGRLPGMVSVGELRYVWQAGVEANELCGCGERVRRVPVLDGGRRGGVRRLGQGRRRRGARVSRPPCCATAASRCSPHRGSFPICARQLERYSRDHRPALRRDRHGRRGRGGGRLDQEPAVCLLPAPLRRGRPAGHPPGARQPRRRRSRG